VLSFSVEPRLNMSERDQETFYRRLLDRVRDAPGVAGAGLVWLRPFSQGAADARFRLEDRPGEEVSAELNNVSPGFFGALDLPLVDGRDFIDAEFLREDAAGGGVVIVTESLARRLSPNGSPVGRRVVMDYPEGRVRTIVGVVRDTRQRRTVSVSLDAMFEPFGQTFASGWASVVARLDAPEAVVVPELGRVVAALDPALPIYDVVRLDAALREQFADELLLLRLMGAFAGIATLVAAAGLYGVLTRAVTERRREIGIRLALGATPGSISRIVRADGIRMLVTGATLGLAAGWWLARYLQAHLYGVDPLDAVSVAVTLGLVTVVALSSSAIPARRASTLDPADVLRPH
jgi:hypothetical protein